MFERSSTISRLFKYVLAQPSHKRDYLLAEIARDDAELARELRDLLDAGEPRTGTTAVPGPAGPTPQTCPACKASVAQDKRFCSECGTPIGPHPAEHGGPFRTGSLFAGRFRIVAKLGEGGMGVVYRAHDLSLDQPVAVKVLNDARLLDAEVARQRLRSEVRLARQIAHPNVCRVYDLGETGDNLYVSMEYVDGEDLGSLLSRIGRLPVDKGMEVGRKLCAGLAAAHARGVLHRDLKPRNIMIDAHGEVRIMDFGLAVLATQLEQRDIASGTPMYMAPEQLAGREVTRLSDLYALGLVLYELFTGKRPFAAKSVGELLRLRESSDITLPSRHVTGLSGELDRVILQCLDADPLKRPSSALHVAVALPAGDPLADAIAAGETPAPSIVAAAGANEALHPATASTLLAAAIAGLAIACILTPRVQVAGRVPLQQPPAALAAKAHELVRSLGYPDAVHSAAAFRFDAAHVEYVAGTMPQAGRSRSDEWSAALSRAPYPLSFWYYQSSTPPVPGARDPLSWSHVLPPDLSTRPEPAVLMKLDLDGRLLRFAASVPPARGATQAARAPDWTALFGAAGLDLRQFSPSSPLTALPMFDEQKAWTGNYINSREPVRVEAASYGGAVVLFEILFPWTGSANRAAAAPAASDVLLLALLVLIAAVAAHNWRLQRGDPRGCWRLGVYTAGTYFLSLSLTMDPSLLPAAVWIPMAFSLSFGLIVAMVYLALEPWVRRLWPHALITWTRVLYGRWRNAVVGRDVLVGVAAACANAVLQRAVQLAAIHLGATPMRPAEDSATFGFYLGNLASDRLMVADRVMAFVRSLDVLMFFFVVFIARVLLKRQWRATIAYLLFWNLILAAPSVLTGDWMMVIYWTIELSAVLFLTVRLGLLATVTFGTCSILISRGVLTPDFAAWYGRSSAVTAAIVAALAISAFRVSLGGRRLWDAATLERNALARVSNLL